MKKKLLIILSICLIAVGANMVKAETVNTTITMDGDMSDWDNVPALISEDAPDPTLENSTDLSTTYYWDHDSLSWLEGIDETACMYNDMRPLKVYTLKFANDGDYMYFYWMRKTDHMDYFWVDGENLSEQGFSTDPVTINEFDSTPPCEGDLIYNPADYDHDIIFSFDTNLDGNFDYYLVMNITAPQGTPGVEYSYTVNSYIYQDDGSGIYDGMDVETLVADLGADYEQHPSWAGCNNGVCQEGRLAINSFFTDLGITWGDAVWVRSEAHSDSSWISSKSLYSFNKNNKLKLKINTPKNNKYTYKKNITLSGTVKNGSRIKVYINGERKNNFISGNGLFEKVISLKKGANAVVVKAKKGETVITKAVKVRRK